MRTRSFSTLPSLMSQTDTLCPVCMCGPDPPERPMLTLVPCGHDICALCAVRLTAPPCAPTEPASTLSLPLSIDSSPRTGTREDNVASSLPARTIPEYNSELDRIADLMARSPHGNSGVTDASGAVRSNQRTLSELSARGAHDPPLPPSVWPPSLDPVIACPLCRCPHASVRVGDRYLPLHALASARARREQALLAATPQLVIAGVEGVARSIITEMIQILAPLEPDHRNRHDNAALRAAEYGMSRGKDEVFNVCADETQEGEKLSGDKRSMSTPDMAGDNSFAEHESVPVFPQIVDPLNATCDLFVDNVSPDSDFQPNFSARDIPFRLTAYHLAEVNRSANASSIADRAARLAKVHADLDAFCADVVLLVCSIADRYSFAELLSWDSTVRALPRPPERLWIFVLPERRHWMNSSNMVDMSVDLGLALDRLPLDQRPMTTVTLRTGIPEFSRRVRKMTQRAVFRSIQRRPLTTSVVSSGPEVTGIRTFAATKAGAKPIFGQQLFACVFPRNMRNHVSDPSNNKASSVPR